LFDEDRHGVSWGGAGRDWMGVNASHLHNSGQEMSAED
jgi:hypothetical protein